MYEFNYCTGELRDIFGQTSDVTFHASNKLTDGHLQATISGFDRFSEVEVQVAVDLAFVAVGELGSESSRDRLKLPGVMVSEFFKGTFRYAQVSGTVTVGGENVATDPIDAFIYQVRAGSYEMERTR